MSSSDKPHIALLDGAFYADDPDGAFAWMRANDPVYRDEATEIWGISRHSDIKAISKHPELFSSAGGSRPETGPLAMMIDMDAPEHVARRRLVSSGFTPRNVRGMEDKIRATCDELIDTALERGSVDFVADVAAPLPMIVIGDLLGVRPEDRSELLRWSDDLLVAQGSSDPVLIEKMLAAFVDWQGYNAAVVADRRASGKSDDLIGILVHAEIDGQRLDDDALLYESLLILIGGDETTRHVISGGMAELLEHPDQVAALRSDPTKVALAVEEMLRWVTPIKNMNRTVNETCEFGGKTFEAGDKLLLLYPSANRDEAVFDRPFAFDSSRTPNDHVAFGFGAHFCMGNQLARLEIRCMVEQLLKRTADITIDAPRPLPVRPASFVSGIEKMPVTLTPA